MCNKSSLPDRWWETCACISRVFSKRDKIPLRETINQLDSYQKQGIGCIEIFAPYHGGDQYGALDPMNYYIIDPEIGVMADFLELIKQCRRRGMAVIIFINLGYAAMNFGDFLKAQDDMSRGIDSRETRLFIWSDDDKKPFENSFSRHFGKGPEGNWQYSARAGKFYWVKWRGFKGDVALPQFNFASEEWREECKKITRFWMETGIDGVIIDAPYSYANCDFDIHNECITDIIREYPNQYIQPEGGGAAGEDLTRWLTDAHYNSLQDYSIYQGWFKASIIEDVIKNGETPLIEKAFCGWRDKVVQAGGTTYLGLIWSSELTPEQRLLEFAAIAATGAIVHDDNKLMFADYPPEIKKKIADIFRLCATTPALRLNGSREAIICEDGIYAFLRYGAGGEKAVVVLNFSGGERTVEINIPTKLKNALTGIFQEPGKAKITLGAYGYAIYC